MTISIKKTLVLGALAALMIFSVATPAHADWYRDHGRGHYWAGGYGRGYYWGHPRPYFPVVVGSPPPVYMAPQPVYAPPVIVPAYGYGPAYGPSLTVRIR